MRSLAIAEAVRETGDLDVRYLVSHDSCTTPIEDAGFDVRRVPDGPVAAWRHAVSAGAGPLLLDSYGIHEVDLDELRLSGYAVALCDDGCRLRRYNADVVIDGSSAALALPYAGAGDTRFLLGPAYFPLRRAIRDRRAPFAARERVRRLFVTFGGSDPDDATARVVDVLRQTDVCEQITVVLGPSYQGRVTEGESGAYAIVRNPVDYADLAAAADVVITGAGLSAIECAALGRPLLTLVLSADQRPNARALGDAGAAVSLGELCDFDGERFSAALAAILSDATRRAELGGNGRALVDGQGAVRIATEVVDLWRRHQAAATPGVRAT